MSIRDDLHIPAIVSEIAIVNGRLAKLDDEDCCNDCWEEQFKAVADELLSIGFSMLDLFEDSKESEESEEPQQPNLEPVN